MGRTRCRFGWIKRIPPSCYSASRRVARTIFIGSAPKLEAATKGIDDSRIKVGCAQPGETVATFGDALRRITDQTTYLYQDGRRYWYSTQPGVTRLAQDRAAQQSDDDIFDEIRRRLKAEARTKGDFTRIYACIPHGEIADEAETRLVIVDPAEPHSSKNPESAAIKAAAEYLNNRGTSPRLMRNTLFFLAADRARLEDLKKAVRDYLAWKSSERDSESLNLDAFQRNQAKTKHEEADATVAQRIPEAYMWLLVPGEKKVGENGQSRLEWTELKPTGNEALAVKVSKRLKSDGLLITNGQARCFDSNSTACPYGGAHMSRLNSSPRTLLVIFISHVCGTAMFLEKRFPKASA
ncbi:MAG TPA: hypothetical protein VJ728_03070 [Candidatus Binataceae bacterium]|nr:hypothetical protein [Candidatus Binataceae bacterium]